MPPTKSPTILDEVRDVIRLHHYSLHTTMIYTHILHQGGQEVLSPLDDLEL
jgi:hypothetical protein